MTQRTTMNGKPVLDIPAKTVVNFKSGFEHKLLCDGPTFTMGDACAYSCSFCYVPSVMRKHLVRLEKDGSVPAGTDHFNVVLRRRNGLEILRKQLRSKKFTDADRGKVIYASPLVDVAANMDLARETLEACRIILRETPWHIRLLSKSTFLPVIASGIDRYSTKCAQRMIYGVSTGTFDDKLAQAFEQGCPPPSKRIESLVKIYEMGLRTFGMICPSLPSENSDAAALEAAVKLKPYVTEHVWAEVINVRGESMARTHDALAAGGFPATAAILKMVSEDQGAWEDYSRQTFLSHMNKGGWGNMPTGEPRLRFLQYVNDATLPWWNSQVANGAVLL